MTYGKRRWLGLANFYPVLPLNRNCPIDVLHRSLVLFLYNGNIGLNGKVGGWLK